MAPARVTKPRSCQISVPGKGRASGCVMRVTAAPGASPSGPWPSEAGVCRSTTHASQATTTTITTPAASAAPPKPSAAISATQSGENTMPPTLAPL